MEYYLLQTKTTTHRYLDTCKTKPIFLQIIYYKINKIYLYIFIWQTLQFYLNIYKDILGYVKKKEIKNIKHCGYEELR